MVGMEIMDIEPGTPDGRLPIVQHAEVIPIGTIAMRCELEPRSRTDHPGNRCQK